MDTFYQFIAIASLVGYWLLVAGTAIRVVIKRRAVSVSLAWLMIIFVLPVVGIILYYMFGELNLGRKRAERAKNMFAPYATWFNQLHDCQPHQPKLLDEQIIPIHDLCIQRTLIPALCGNHLKLNTKSSDILKSILADIEQSTESIRMEFYIWHPGGLVDAISAALILASHRGVKVQISADSAGSQAFFKSHWPAQFKDANIELIEALKVAPIRMLFRRLDLRQHRKIVVIDNHIAYTGSMNMVDPPYFKQDAGVGEWIDVMVRLTGPTVNVLSAIHAWDWEVETGARYLPNIPVCETPASIESSHPIQVVPSGPGMPVNLIQQVLILSMMQAKDSIRLTTPYFVPSEQLLQAMIMTAQRGVTVELILPKKNDSVLVAWASKSFFTELLEAGVEIYQFEGGLLHTKSVVIDKHFSLVGTVNLDMRSLWLNFELTLIIQDHEFSEQFYHLQQSYIDNSTRIIYKDWLNRGYGHKLLEKIFYLLNPLL